MTSITSSTLDISWNGTKIKYVSVKSPSEISLTVFKHALTLHNLAILYNLLFLLFSFWNYVNCIYHQLLILGSLYMHNWKLNIKPCSSHAGRSCLLVTMVIPAPMTHQLPQGWLHQKKKIAALLDFLFSFLFLPDHILWDRSLYEIKTHTSRGMMQTSDDHS